MSELDEYLDNLCLEDLLELLEQLKAMTKPTLQ